MHHSFNGLRQTSFLQVRFYAAFQKLILVLDDVAHGSGSAWRNHPSVMVKCREQVQAGGAGYVSEPRLAAMVEQLCKQREFVRIVVPPFNIVPLLFSAGKIFIAGSTWTKQWVKFPDATSSR